MPRWVVPERACCANMPCSPRGRRHQGRMSMKLHMLHEQAKGVLPVGKTRLCLMCRRHNGVQREG